ncbi:DUF6134 family protein [Marinobacterium sp. MBR-109]|jgi:hypothetical protein|uniref:DUF6134 family protein n=1 Tax=Marinobacterium sp. MBR-109 TaxID=3156462 RepID=UPI00339525EC
MRACHYILLSAILLLGMLPATGRAAALPAGQTPLDLYGAEALYTVERKGKTIGHYRLQFDQQPDQLQVHVEMVLQIRVLALFNYRFEYTASEQWSADGQLQQLSVSIDNDGKRTQHRIERQNNQLCRVEAAGCDLLGQQLLTSNHWHPHLPQQQQLLNTLTGQVSQLNVTDLGRETLSFGNDSIVATHYQLGGDLDDTHSWYDQNGRWLGMEFSARDGSRIRVRLQPESAYLARKEAP